MFIPNPSCFLVLCLSRSSPGVNEAGVKEVRQAPGSCASSQGRLFLAQPPARIAFPALSSNFPLAPVAEPGRDFPTQSRCSASPGALSCSGTFGKGTVEPSLMRQGARNWKLQRAAPGLRWEPRARRCREPQIPRQSAASQQPALGQPR